VQYLAEETELVVLVTPELVAPLLPEQIAYVPGADVVQPNDGELFLEGRLEGRRGQPAGGAADVQAQVWPARSADWYGPAVCRLRGPVGPAGSDEGG
jgi:Flp pilus assembly secretin CpaC